jgi:hypothetical protein
MEPRRPRVTPAVAGAVVAAFVVGGVVAIAVDRATRNDTGTLRGTETVAEAPVDTLEQPPSGPLRVVANIVQLPAGYEAKLVNNGPTFTFVDFGRVQVETAERRTVYGAGSFYTMERGRLYQVRVLDDAQLSVVRLLRPGETPTREVG